MNATAFSRGLQDAGTLSCAKHFPGHGDTATDSHLHLPVLSKSASDLMAEELVPFQALIRNGVDAVMVGHIAVPALTNGTPVSSSVSGEIINGLLRKSLGYQGVVVSDALNMHSVSKAFPEKGSLEWTAFEAGTDVLCFAEHVRAGIDKILENASEDRIEESFKRVWRLKEKAFQSPGSALNLSAPDSYNKMAARNSLTFHKGQQEILLEFRNKGFFALSLGKEKGVKFNRKLGLKRNSYLEVKGHPEFSDVQEKIGEGSRVLLSIFLPRAKPEGRFGLHEKTLDLIIRLIENYRVIVYLFGNPYFLRYLPQDKMEAIVLCYQDLKGFEEVAAEHFQGQFEATGVLPVSI